MAGEWPTKTIDELKAKSRAAIAIGPFGSRMKSDCYVPSGVPVIRGTNISDTRDLVGEMVYITPEKAAEVQSSIIFADDLFFPHRGSIGLVGIVPRKGAARYVQSSSMMKLTCDRSLVEPLYLFYFFRSAQGRQELLKNASTVGTPGIGQPLSSLKAIHVPYPPLAEQKAIAAALGALDDKIELNRRMNATLEAMARALFQSWFVDFDPVRAKLDARPPAGLDPATAALFPDHLEDSPLGHIPKGWIAMPLPEAVEVNPRRTLKSGTIAPYLDMKNLPTQGHSADEVVDREFSSGTKFQNGDTLLARITPCLENGKTGYVDFLEDSQVGWGSTEYIVFAPKAPLPPQFGYLLARSDALRTHAIQNMTGTSGRQRVPSDCFEKFLLAVPPPAIACRFDELTAPLMAKIKANSNESRTLATLRDTLLPKLLSGEVSIENFQTSSQTN
jgi:type I restriction enzyme S subunit